MTPISKIHTPCKDCVFALYNDITQVGCKTKTLDIFKQRGVTILEVYDEEKEFYVIIIIEERKGFIVTAYISEEIKQGEIKWKKWICLMIKKEIP